MNIITQNPFRVLGLTGNSSERELQKHIGIIKRYAEIGKSKTFDYDFEFMGGFSRTLEDIQKAASRIEQAQKKLHYSLFWFIKNNQFDEIALNNLKDQNIEKAIEIWEKTLKEEVSNKNYASYLNLSTLYIALSSIDGQLDIQKLQKGIDLKGKLINSDSIKDFSKLVTGNGLAIDAEDISKKFIEEIIELQKPYLNKSNGITTNELIFLFNSYPKNIQKYLSGKFTEVPISNIENKIEKTIAKRNENPRDAEEYGEELYKTTKSDITLLKELLGGNNVQFQMIANKLANEIMQCAIDYYNIHREDDGDIDPGDDALRIAKYALSIGPTEQIKQRIEENTAPIQEWVNDKPERKKQEIVKSEFRFITQKLIEFQNKGDSISNATNLISSCKNHLNSMKLKLNNYDEFYLNISTAVASNAQGMVVSVVNTAMEKRNKYVKYVNYKNDPFSQIRPASFGRYTGNDLLDSLYEKSREVPYAPEYSLSELKSVIKEAFSATILIGDIDMLPKQKQHYNKNKESLKSLASQIGISTIGATIFHGAKKAGNQVAKKSSGGCYIASMSYGSYAHPQVMVLRKFRDEKLAHSLFGRGFIKFYYATSPKFVRALKNHKRINEIIRNLFDEIIKHIK